MQNFNPKDVLQLICGAASADVQAPVLNYTAAADSPEFNNS